MNFQSDIIRGDEKAVFSFLSLYSSFGFKQFRMSKFEEYDLYVKNKDFLVSNEVITWEYVNKTRKKNCLQQGNWSS